MKKVLINLLSVIVIPVRILGELIPQRKNLVVLGAMNGKNYGDNSKYVFEYLLKNEPELECVWLTRSIRVYRFLKEKRRPVYRSNSIKGIWLLFRASVGLFTNSLRDLAIDPFLVPRNLKLIALRHGKSVKKVRFARKNHKISKKEERERKYESDLISYVISTSDFVSRIQEECLQLGLEKSAVTGYPRNDVLFDKNREKIIKDKNISVLYAPSWRHGREATKFFPFEDFDKNELVKFLEESNISIYLRPHKNDLSKYRDLVEFLEELTDASENLYLATHERYPDINNVLRDFDVLITDYSSIYHDYLLLDRPILFIPYDFAIFEKENGFVYDYKKFLPGPRVNSFEELTKELDSVWRNDNYYSKNRNSLKIKVHKYFDGYSSKRVADLIKSLL